MVKIVPVLLAGGSGSRLWPLSRKSYPKQFTKLVGDESLFQACAKRLSGSDFTAPLVLTGPDFRFLVSDQLHDCGIKGATVLVEPAARNTAPAILAAALWLERTDPEAVMLVAPSDHIIPDSDAFKASASIGYDAAKAGHLVTFGIAPTHAETGYGYLELEDSKDPYVPLKRFVEKPKLADAQAMLASGNFLWNAGIFMFSAQSLISAFETHAPQDVDAVRAAVAQAEPDLNFYRLAAEPWNSVQDISIDYAVMERADNLVVVPFGAGWSDLGDWASVSREMSADESGNVLSGPATALECENSLIRTEDDSLQAVGLGLKDTIVVATKDAVLVADKSRAQEVRNVVDTLKAARTPQATEFPWDQRPWGMFESLAKGDRFQVKRIVVKPGGILSLQSHEHRAEHWIVVAGTARVTIDEQVMDIHENQSVYIPQGAVHRMENAGDTPMILIEVQTGSYLGEDDIKRYEDAYARGQGAKG